MNSLNVAYSSLSLQWLTLVLTAICLLSCLTIALYNIYFHPLAAIPGPRLFATSRLPYIWYVLTGRLAFTLHELHEKYGPVVRTASNEVSFISPEAWETIYGRNNTRHEEFAKNYDTWNETANDFTKTVFLASHQDHPRMRKALSPAFSNRTLRQNVSMLQDHITKFLTGIENDSRGDGSSFGEAVDLNNWFNWLAFDTVSDFVLGQCFNCLTDAKHRPWLKSLSMTWHFISIVSSIKSLGRAKDTLALMMPRKLLQRYIDQLQLVGRMALKKLHESHQESRTLMSVARSAVKEPAQDQKGEALLSDKEILSNAELVVTAGTDTSATALPAIIYLLCNNRTAYQKVVQEVRGASSEDAIDMSFVHNVPYLSACILETLRLHPIVPEGLPRVCHATGQNVCGYWLPGGTFCQISPYAANISSANFERPNDFLPERWLCIGTNPGNKDSNEIKSAFRPFSYGPRDCVGQNFALLSMKLTLCRLFYRFDVACATSENWLDQRCYLLWRRRPLEVYLRPASSSE